MINLIYLMKATGANQINAEKYLKPLIAAMERYEINTQKRVAGFLAQIGHESGHLTSVSENLNYRVEALISMFGRHRISEADAKAYGRNDAIGQKANQEAIANCLYGGEFGKKMLGNTEPGDGWKFRGRGLKQLTGRSNYLRCGDALQINLIENPDHLLTPEGAAMSAGWFWNANNLNSFADAGDMDGMTKKINGGTIGLDARKALYAAAMLEGDPFANLA